MCLINQGKSGFGVGNTARMTPSMANIMGNKPQAQSSNMANIFSVPAKPVKAAVGQNTNSATAVSLTPTPNTLPSDTVAVGADTSQPTAAPEATPYNLSDVSQAYAAANAKSALLYRQEVSNKQSGKGKGNSNGLTVVN